MTQENFGMDEFSVTQLSRTWVLDLDGTLIEHFGDKLLPGVREFLDNVIRPQDVVIITTARSLVEREATLALLNKLNVKFRDILFEVGAGQRIIVNDDKPFGNNRQTAFAVRTKRNKGFSKEELSAVRYMLED